MDQNLSTPAEPITPACTPACGCAHSAPAAAQRKGVNYAAAALWASAFILGALTIVQAGRLPGQAAYAEAANAGQDGTSVVTVATGLGPDNKPYEALWVLDGRSEVLTIYYIENANSGTKSLLLRNMVSLPDLFGQARTGQ